ncbi:hypothetical protein BC827DRAFT_1380025 [Russula dissimulans]|nr:hypothetical protein BC827DRAFT_1380025 [Russula dissimulans]
MASFNEALWATGHDETIEVNQRALIDKVLARYSGEFSVFRELLQNSDDAESHSAEIRFETGGYISRDKGSEPQPDHSQQGHLPDLKTAVVHQWTFKNNGIRFRDEDWNRLKKIAEGNPDEEKIGAFGVGFYSLFSVTEEPWVTSGGQWMNFYWKDKKDQLFARRGTVPVDKVADPWTTFQMTLREPGPIPPAFDFTRFLVSSITFMTHLSEVSVYFDDKRLVKLSKVCGIPKEVPMLKGLRATSNEGMMNVKSIQTTPLHIEAEVVRWVYTVGSEKPSAASKTATLKTASHQASGFFGSLFAGFGGSSTPRRTPTPVPVVPTTSTNLLEAHPSNVTLSIFSANVDVRLNKKMTAELLRSTKKNPPSRLRYELIYTGKDEYDSSAKAEEKVTFATGSVFQGLRADLEGFVASRRENSTTYPSDRTGAARVFIGHSTGQTTGIGGHMATQFIPTVERESIDLVDRNVALWNKELLYVGGFLARSAYEVELASIKNLWADASAPNGPGGVPNEAVQTRLQGRALHALRFFTFHSSTPSPMVSDLMENAFFTCATTHPFPIVSSEGVRSASQVYSPDPEFSGFVKRLPVIPEDTFDGAKTMIAALLARGMIQNITFVDVLSELRLRALSEMEAVACLKWWVGVTKQGDYGKLVQGRSQLLGALVVSIPGPPEKFMRLSDARTFLNSKGGGGIIPTDGPLPSTVLPTSITRSFDPDVFSSVFPWKQLSIVDWLRHVIDPKVAAANAEFDITHSATWAERVLFVLARAWPTLARATQEDVVKMLSSKTCIPTSIGLKSPGDAYFKFSSVNLFQDLPIVTMPSKTAVKGALEKVLQALGVRKHLELQIVFDRMIRTGDWTTYDLIKYLVSAQSSLTSQEVERLRQTSVFPKEGAVKAQSAPGSRKAQRHRAMDLYEPIDIFRELGLPVIEWGVDKRWKPASDEAKFIFSLGLRRAPPLHEILRIASADNPTARTKAFTFFLDNLSTKYPDYDPHDFRDLAFVPAVLGSGRLLAKPFGLFASPEWASLGFAVVDPLLHKGTASKLKLHNHPPTSDLMTLLASDPPGDEETARRWFEVLSSRVLEFSPVELRKLSETPFIPVTSTGAKGAIRRLPPTQCYFSKTGGSELHSKLFSFVDFGAHANVFLVACGTRQEPSIEQFAQILLEDPRRTYQLADGRENYLFELRNFAVNRRLLTKGTITRMKQSNVLLGSRRVKNGSKSSDEGDEDDLEFEYDLLRPNKVAIADDNNVYQRFGDRIFCAPQEDVLEELYDFLGSPRLSSLVREDYRTRDEIPYSEIGAEIRHLVLERLPLFLHGYPQSRTKVSSNWLNEEKNFTVKVFGKLSVTKSLHHGDIRHSEIHEASAVAKRESKGRIELWLAGNTQVDMYEVSTSLCHLVLESPKVNDVLLFMTILSTDLKALKRRGYNVDRILRRQKAEREAAEKALTLKDEDVWGSSNLVLSTDRRGVSPSPNANIPGGVTASRTLVTPLSNIANNIDMAIKACTHEKNDLLRNREEMQVVRESLDEGYCDISGAMDGVRLYATRGGIPLPKLKQETYYQIPYSIVDLPEANSLKRKRDVLTRFLHILNLLVSVYKIPKTSLHVFADEEGNLAYVLSFYASPMLKLSLGLPDDQEVQQSDLTRALTSWYFTLAHEIAHNLVHPHNSEHEFYFSAICEAYLAPLSELLQDSLHGTL